MDARDLRPSPFCLSATPISDLGRPLSCVWDERDEEMRDEIT